MAFTEEFLAENNSGMLISIATAFTIINTVVYIIFLFSRIFCAERNNLEVWLFTALSYTFCLGLCIIGFYFVSAGGAGRHAAYWKIHDPPVIVAYLKLQTAIRFVYVPACLFPKLSILSFYLRIFPDRSVRVWSWAIIGVCVAAALSDIIVSFVICRPFQYKWNKSIDGKCGDVIASFRYVNLPHIITDVAILILPLPSVFRMLTNKRRKFGIFLTFLMGGLGIVTSILRFVSFYITNQEQDLTWYSPRLVGYSIIEPSAYFMCSCFTSYRPLMRMVYRWLRGKVDKQYGAFGTSTGSQHQISLRNLKVGHQASVSASKGVERQHGSDDDRSKFIRLDESIDVEITQLYPEGRV